MKERIVGAVVLVLFVVLVVPIFLDGPPAGTEMLSERVLLPGQEGQETKTVILDRERSVPMPVADTETTAEVAAPVIVEATVAEQIVVDNSSESAPAALTEEPQAAPLEEPTALESTPPTTSTTGMWAVQLGSFSDKANAEKLAAELRQQEYAAFLSQLTKNGSELHRVRIGPQRDRKSAEAVAAKLLKVGHTGQVVPHP